MADIFLTGAQTQSTTQPAGPSIPSISLWDGSMDSLGSVVGALTQAVNILAGKVPAGSNNDAGSVDGFMVKKQPRSDKNPKPKPDDPKKDNTNKKDATTGRFTEISRTTQSVKITNPSDSSQYVIVNQITQLIMQDNITKEKWVWNL